MSFYAVKTGRNVGVYKTWEECEIEVKGYSGAEYKKFKTLKEAKEFVGDLDTGIEANKNYDKDEEDLIESLNPEEAVAYVDGSFDLDNFTYSYGVVYITSEGKKTYSGRESDKNLSDMRNVAGELRGAMEAMKVAQEDGKKNLYLHYDYTGIEQWARGNWKTNKDGTKKYKEFYNNIINDLNVVFIKVKAHAGIKYNEEADKLAKEAL